MTPISSINQFSAINNRLQFNSLQRTRTLEGTQNFFLDTIQQTPAVLTQTNLINQLPHDQVREVTDIFRSINILASQALELGQDFENREDLQIEVEKEISEARSVFDKFTQDNLTLFIAIFQNQIPGSLIASGSTGNDSGFDLSSNGITNNSLESLLDINVLSEFGALTALDLTDNIINRFTGNNNSSFLESLLDDLTNSLIDSSIFQRLSQTQESKKTTPSSDTETFSDTDTEESIIPIPQISSPDSNPPTIIELAG